LVRYFKIYKCVQFTIVPKIFIRMSCDFSDSLFLSLTHTHTHTYNHLCNSPIWQLFLEVSQDDWVFKLCILGHTFGARHYIILTFVRQTRGNQATQNNIFQQLQYNNYYYHKFRQTSTGASHYLFFRTHVN